MQNASDAGVCHAPDHCCRGRRVAGPSVLLQRRLGPARRRWVPRRRLPWRWLPWRRPWWFPRRVTSRSRLPPFRTALDVRSTLRLWRLFGLAVFLRVWGRVPGAAPGLDPVWLAEPLDQCLLLILLHCG